MAKFIDNKAFHILKLSNGSIGLLFALILGMALRMYCLGGLSLWFDEADVALVDIGPKHIHLFFKYTHPLLTYKLFMYYWKLLGESEFILRLPSVMFGVFSIVLIYKLGKEFFGKRASLIGAFLLAISPFHIYYSQEARMYSLMVLLSLGSVYCLVRFLRSKRNVHLFGYFIFNILNIYTHPFSFFIFLSQLVFILTYKAISRPHFFRLRVCNWLILLFIMPWLFFVVPWADPSHYFAAISWIQKPTFFQVFITFKNFACGYNTSFIFCSINLVIFAALFVFGMLKARKTEFGLLFALCLVLPICLTFLLSFHRPLYLDRYFLPSAAFFYLFVAGGLANVAKRTALILVILISFFTVLALNSYYNNFFAESAEWYCGVEIKKDHRGAANYVIDNLSPGDIVFHTCKNTAIPFQYYFNLNKKWQSQKPDPLSTRQLVLRFDSSKRLLPYEYIIQKGDFSSPLHNVQILGHKRVWLVFSEWDYEKAKANNSNECNILRYMESDYVRSDVREFSGITVYLYKLAGTN